MTGSRVEQSVTRGAAVAIVIDGTSVTAFEGETIAAAMIASGRRTFRRDTSGRARGLFCNMGTCSECFVMVATSTGRRRLRACMTPVLPDMRIETSDGAADG